MLPLRYKIIPKALTSFLFLCVILYALFELRWVLWGPRIVIDPLPSATTTRFIVLRGVADHTSSFTINGSRVQLTERGLFVQGYSLSPGSNHFFFEARDSYGHSNRLTRVVLNTSTSTLPTISTFGTSTSNFLAVPLVSDRHTSTTSLVKSGTSSSSTNQ